MPITQPMQRMTERRFHDAKGREWHVWEVCPQTVERRLSNEVGHLETDRRHGERRTHVRVPEKLQHGWLAFESGGERRRLAPVPQNWRTLCDEELGNLLSSAHPVRN